MITFLCSRDLQRLSKSKMLCVGDASKEIPPSQVQSTLSLRRTLASQLRHETWVLDRNRRRHGHASQRRRAEHTEQTFIAIRSEIVQRLRLDLLVNALDDGFTNFGRELRRSEHLPPVRLLRSNHLPGEDELKRYAVADGPNVAFRQTQESVRA